MENGELMLSKKRNVDQSGYSEKKLDQDTDLQAGQWLDLKKGASKTGKNTQKTNVQPSVLNTQSKKNTTQTSEEKEKIVKELLEQTTLYQTLTQEYSTRDEYISKETERLLQRIFTVQSTIKTLLQSLKKTS